MVTHKVGFHHDALTVSDLQRSVAWYRDVFGFKLWHERETAELHFVELELNGFILELFSFGAGTTGLPSYRHELLDDLHVAGTKHFALRVADLDQELTSLASRRIQAATDIDTVSFGGRYVFIRDPDGILIELIEID